MYRGNHIGNHMYLGVIPFLIPYFSRRSPRELPISGGSEGSLRRCPGRSPSRDLWGRGQGAEKLWESGESFEDAPGLTSTCFLVLGLTCSL